MEYVILILGLIFLVSGILGSFLPIVPGPPLSWLGLWSLYLIPDVPQNFWLLSITFVCMLFITLADYFIPGYYSKKKGGSKFASWGASIGLIIGLIFFPPLGMLVGLFLGAFLGELLFNRQATSNQAFNSAKFAFIGFLASTFIKFFVCLCFLGIYLYKIWEFRSIIF